VSDDRRHAVVLIAFIGSVFSPFYFSARQRGDGCPYDHCAVNVALYGPRSKHWAFSEYRCSPADFGSDGLAIGSSALAWNDPVLDCRILETGAPLPRALRGRIRIHAEALPAFRLALDSQRRHWWRPIAPRATVEVEFEQPAVRWRGVGYLDSNHGTAPLDEGMRAWTWQRAHTSRGTRVLYDIHPAEGPPASHALDFEHSGRILHPELPPEQGLPRTLWHLGRQARSERGSAPRVLATLEDAPFYARTLVQTVCRGERLATVHETLSLERFRSSWVRALLPFRMRWSRR
jgi:carotenoid 1,2-hydratase